MPRTLTFAAIAIISAVLAFCSASATTVVVDASGGGDFLTIQEGVTAAASGDTVLVAAGTYTGTGNRGVDFLAKDLAVLSQDGAGATTIDCGYLDRAFYVHSGESIDSTIEGFTITNGRASEGGAICVTSGSSCTIRHCVIEDCYTEFNSYNGGGVYAGLNSTLHMLACTLRDNYAAYGAAAHFADGAQVEVEDCEFLGNLAQYSGGGIYIKSGAEVLVSSTILVENTADTGYGGGVVVQSASATIEDCTLYANSAGDLAGGIGVFEAAVDVIRTVISHSTSGAGVGAVFGTDANVQIWNCDVYANAGGDGLIGTHWDNISADPLYCDASSGDLSLCADSPCVSANNHFGVGIGGVGHGCTECGTGAAEDRASWGAVKALYR